jgi:hypothetical protein
LCSVRDLESIAALSLLKLVRIFYIELIEPQQYVQPQYASGQIPAEGQRRINRNR